MNFLKLTEIKNRCTQIVFKVMKVKQLWVHFLYIFYFTVNLYTLSWQWINKRTCIVKTALV